MNLLQEPEGSVCAGLSARQPCVVNWQSGPKPRGVSAAATCPGRCSQNKQSDRDTVLPDLESSPCAGPTHRIPLQETSPSLGWLPAPPPGCRPFSEPITAALRPHPDGVCECRGASPLSAAGVPGEHTYSPASVIVNSLAGVCRRARLQPSRGSQAGPNLCVPVRAPCEFQLVFNIAGKQAGPTGGR